MTIGNGDPVLKEVIEIEHHLHNREKWFGLAAVALGELHVADRMAGGIDPFQLVAGNLTFGSWVQILGATDTPVGEGMVKFDGHRVIVTDTNSVDPFIVQIAVGELVDLAALIAAEEFTEFPYISASNNNDSGISEIISRRISAGQKVWARVCCIGSNGSTIDIYFGIHEYQA